MPRLADEITLNLPAVHRNRVYFSWYPNRRFARDAYWVEYPDLGCAGASQGKLAESLFPLCLAFSVLDRCEIHLPVRLPDSVLAAWNTSIDAAAARCFRRPRTSRLVNGRRSASYGANPASKTVLFFGGGTESLLTLARLLERGEKPCLASFGGPKWSGSDPERNKDKFEMDGRVASRFGLELLQVRSNFREILDADRWASGVRDGLSIVNSVTLLPFFLSFILPVAERIGAGKIVSGNEKMNFPHEYWCFSPAMTRTYADFAAGVRYESHLSDMLKEDICRELYTKYPEVANYQYSCWRNQNQRWCCNCESCLEYYALLKTNGVSVETVGFDEERIRANREGLVAAVATSAEGRRGEIWERLCRSEVLRRDEFFRKVLDEIAVRATIYHSLRSVYDRTPHWFKEVYRSQKHLLARPALRTPMAPALVTESKN